MRPATTRRPRPTLSPSVALPSIVAAILAATMLWASAPTAGAATVMRAACDAVNLRIAPTTSDQVVTRISTGTTVGVTATVTAGPWSATCAGVAVAGDTWYQIESVGGTGVAALYGVPFVYGATGLFTPEAPFPPGASTPDPTPLPPAAPAPIEDQAISEGIDVSHWQGSIDWAAVAASGKRFAYMKASEGTSFVDTTYPTNRAQAKAVGLYVGAYHFARPNATLGDAEAEADHFLATARIDQGELLPVLDLEETGGLSVPALQAWVRSYLERIYVRTGVRAVIYVSPSFWRNYMGDTDWFALNGYRTLWIAHWTTSTSPSVPARDWAGYGWTFWQYTSSGSVPGISGRVDLNRYRGDDFSPVLVGSVPTMPPPPPPGPPVPSIALTTSAPVPAGAQAPVITWGEGFTLGLAFDANGAGRTVVLEGSGDRVTWTPIATLTMDASGRASYAYRPVTNLYYRAAFAGAPDLQPAVSNEVRTVVRQKALLRPTNLGATKSIRRGSAITFSTTIRPARPELPPPTASFSLYRQVSGSWRLVTKRTAVADATGVARTTFTFSSSGQWYVRSQANPTPLNANSVMSPIERYSVR